VAALLSCALMAPSASAWDCSFRSNPDRFLGQEARVRFAIHNTAKLARPDASGRAAAVDPADIPRRNFIDDFIFGAMERQGVKSAALSSDQEFLRRIYFDLTGHPPSPADIRAFLDKPDRNGAIDRLLYTREFVDRWTMWLGDLLQNTAFPANFDRQYFGRNAFYKWMLFAVAEDKSLRDIAIEAVGTKGNNYDNKTGSANFPLNGIVAMSPAQDTYDNIFMKSASAFLGLSNYDCLLCHDGRGHLEQVNLWGSKATRLEAQRQAAFFGRISLAKPNVAATHDYYNSYNVSDATRGFYNLNTLPGNRPERAPVGGLALVEPEYRDGRKPSSEDWRQEYARFLVDDPMFAINFANRLWKEVFTMGLVEPVDSLDPARLDPANPPSGNWTLQPTHPELLQKLASELKERNYALRDFLRLLFESSAYQLSSRYDGEWQLSYVPLFARHYPRRLEGEEVHDTIVKATNIQTNYTLRDLDTTPWAMQMPEPVEPRSNGASVNFMNPFYRGNRDSFFRVQDGSVQQQLNLMNDTFILNRLRVASSSTLREAAAMANNGEAIDQLFLLLLQRLPDAREKKVAADYLAKAGNQRNTYIEDLAWSLINKTDFLYNY
jgi:hypothetical protein